MSDEKASSFPLHRSLQARPDLYDRGDPHRPDDSGPGMAACTSESCRAESGAAASCEAYRIHAVTTNHTRGVRRILRETQRTNKRDHENERTQYSPPRGDSRRGWHVRHAGICNRLAAFGTNCAPPLIAPEPCAVLADLGEQGTAHLLRSASWRGTEKSGRQVGTGQPTWRKSLEGACGRE
jgi:hypothetical protein